MFIDYKNEYLRFSGRFAEYGGGMTTTAVGSSIEVGFFGDMLLLKFDLNEQKYPFPHLWLQLDGGDWFEASVDWYLRINAKNKERHILKLILKSAVEFQNRWKKPIEPKVTFIGAYADDFIELPPDNRKTIEFIGDSITEGVLTDPMCAPFENDGNNRVFENDVFATYAYRTAEALNLKPIFAAYGGIGLTMAGSGNMPGAQTMYCSCFEGSPVTYASPHYIVINLGTNDHLWKSVDEYINGYRSFLEMITNRHPFSKITVLTSFSGVFPAETKQLVEDFNKEHNSDIFFIDSTGWIPPEPLHPDRSGHKLVAEHLTAVLKEKYGI